MLAHYLTTKGFSLISGGDILREKMTTEGLPLDRTSMNAYVKKLYTEKGSDALIKEIIAHIKGNAVIPGFRNMFDVKYFREVFRDSFKLIHVHAPLEVRYQRVLFRQRAGDTTSFEEFKEQDERERNDGTGSHEVDQVIEAADFTIENNGTQEEFFAKIDALVQLTRYNISGR